MLLTIPLVATAPYALHQHLPIDDRQQWYTILVGVLYLQYFGAWLNIHDAHSQLLQFGVGNGVSGGLKPLSV